MLYLIRHAHAVPASEDPLRPLSLAGVQECALLVRFFAENHQLLPTQIWHSPHARSRETADRLAAGLNQDSARVEIPGILGDDDPRVLLARVNDLPPGSEIAVVGHDPHLTRLASLLIRGRSKPALMDLKKGSVLALEKTETRHKKSGQPRWMVCWYMTPGLLKVPQGAATPPKAKPAA
ncbi:MAG: hypothetical protein HS122_06040 [Opitutaceae bacterium]|nr:hypothetical protein [Opitutaceae bacterium]